MGPDAQVLNVAGNKLSGTLRIKGVPKLRALIANDNEITAVKGRSIPPPGLILPAQRERPSPEWQ